MQEPIIEIAKSCSTMSISIIEPCIDFEILQRLVPLQDSIIEIEIDTDLALLFPMYPVRRCKNLRKNQTPD
jgi:hypothetical protein